MAPLSAMSGYLSNLRAISQGRANFRMDYDHYEEVPRSLPPDDTFPSAMAMRA